MNFDFLFVYFLLMEAYFCVVILRIRKENVFVQFRRLVRKRRSRHIHENELRLIVSEGRHQGDTRLNTNKQLQIVNALSAPGQC